MALCLYMSSEIISLDVGNGIPIIRSSQHIHGVNDDGWCETSIRPSEACCSVIERTDEQTRRETDERTLHPTNRHSLRKYAVVFFLFLKGSLNNSQAPW